MSNLVQFPGLGLEFEISRVVFTIGNLSIYWYGLLIGCGLFLALLFAFRYAVDFGIDADRLVDVILIGTICAVICARLYYVAFSPIAYNSLWDMINIRNGGIAIYGAVIGAAVFGGLACKWRKIPILPTFDLVAMGFLIGQSIGRWGNFVNQEAFGSNTTLPWGMKSAATQNYLAAWQQTLANQGVTVDPNMPVHPTFLYESLWCAVGFFALWAYMKKRRFNGEIALMYVAWYGAGRFWIEGLRTDSLVTSGMNLRVSQVLALVSVVAALALIVVLRKRNKGEPLNVSLPLTAEVLKTAKQQQPEVFKNAGAIGIIAALPAASSHAKFVKAQKELPEQVIELLKQMEKDAADKKDARAVASDEKNPEPAVLNTEDTVAADEGQEGHSPAVQDKEGTEPQQ